MQKAKQKLSLTAIEQDILTLLQGKRLYGLKIVQGVEAASNGARSIKYGSLYPLLAQLEEKGFVLSEWGNEKSGGGRRKYYSITSAGKAILQEVNDFRKSLAEWKAILHY
jgi:DNA-binding PadR family transcriptional regulator